MALNLNNIRSLLKPQDIVAAAIMLLGIFIAIFLPDGVIKLIGVSVAVLGMAALYMTIRGRINDANRTQMRRTALAPPAFKTRVARDSGASATRIVFDDFQQQYDPADDQSMGGDDDYDEGFRPVTSTPASKPRSGQTSPAQSSQPPPPRSPDDHGDHDQDDDDDVSSTAAAAGQGTFRVIGTRSSATPARPEAEVEPEAEPASQPKRRAVDMPGPEMTPVIELPDLPDLKISLAPEPEAGQPGKGQTKRVQMILEDLASGGDEEAAFNESRTEFVRLTGQLLKAIARSIPARSIAYFWVNHEKMHYIPEAVVSGDHSQLRLGQRLPLGGDILSQIALGRAAEILTDIDTVAEPELFPYYTSPAGIRSFVGVPVFFQHEVVGVLAADSTDANAFDESSVASLAEYTRLITGLIRSYTEKYDLQLSAQALMGLNRLNRSFIGARTTPLKIVQNLIENVTEIVDASYIAAVLFDPDAMQWRVPFSVSDLPFGTVEHRMIDLETSLTGRATQFAEEICIERVAGHVRFSQSEKLPDGGTFLALPLVGVTKCYGALALEHPKASAYLHRDVDMLRTLVRSAAMAIESNTLNTIVETSVVHDPQTGMYTRNFLLQTLDREMQRAADFSWPLSFVLLSPHVPDSVRQYVDPLTLNTVVNAEVSRITGAALRQYDTAGVYDDHGAIAVILPGRTDQDTYLWAEKLRKEIASHIIEAGQRSFSVTVSAGICETSQMENVNAVLDGATQALDRARANDGNTVVVY